MTVKVIEADIERDIHIFVELLNRNRGRRIERDRFEWLYMNNPTGKARAWIVVDENTDCAVAFTCVHPRLVKVDGKDILCWNCGDFSVDKKYRTLGVALKLRRKAKECVDRGEIRALYAHPNDRMKVIHDTVGNPCIGEMQRFTKVLRANRYIKEKIKISVFSDILCFGINLAMKGKDHFLLSGNKHFTFELLSDEPYGEEYDRFFDESSKNYRIIGDRRASYLNWRYGQNPIYKTERVTLRKDSHLMGYIIFYVEKNVAVFKDILVSPDKNAAKCLLGFWIKTLNKRGIDSISAIFMTANPLIKVFKEFGFIPRPEFSSVHAYANQDDDIAKRWLDGSNWYMTVGDRDV